MTIPVRRLSRLCARRGTGALDSASGRQILELFAQLHEAGATILMITHDASVASHAQTLYHIRDGVLTGEKEGYCLLYTSCAGSAGEHSTGARDAG